MKIDWKARLTNKTFLAGFAGAIITFAYQILGLCGVIPAISQDQVTQLVGLVLNMLVGLAVVIDPSTKGLSDSQIAQETGNVVQSTNAEEKVKNESTTTSINNTVNVNSTNVKVDNPDNVQVVGAIVSATSADKPQ